eukprot:10084090-Alexandrium_andersonii.AAC.1
MQLRYARTTTPTSAHPPLPVGWPTRRQDWPENARARSHVVPTRSTVAGCRELPGAAMEAGGQDARAVCAPA